MNSPKDWLLTNSHELLVPLLTFAATVTIGLIARNWILRALHRWTVKTKGKLDDILVGALSGPSLLWLLILGLHLAAQFSPLPDKAQAVFSKVLLALWVLSFTIVASRMASSWVKRFYGSVLGTELPATTLSQNLARFFVILIGVLWLLNLLGVSITPVLTALGVGGLAVALALQDTLSNLFAGIYTSLARQVRVGDYIRLNTGEEGYVSDFTWRSTTIRALAGNMILVPNSKLAQAIITNYHLENKRMAVPMRVPATYDSDPDEVERLLIEEATRAIGAVPGLLSTPVPVVRFNPGFGESALEFTLVVHVEDFESQFAVQHELRKRIFRRFRAEGIVIPYPTRSIRMERPARE